MIASLNHCSSSASCVQTLMSGMTFTAGSHATEQQRRVVLRIDAQPHATPLERVALATHQVFDRCDAAALVGRPNLDIAEMEPELPRFVLGESDRDGDAVLAV